MGVSGALGVTAEIAVVAENSSSECDEFVTAPVGASGSPCDSGRLVRDGGWGGSARRLAVNATEQAVELAAQNTDEAHIVVAPAKREATRLGSVWRRLVASVVLGLVTSFAVSAGLATWSYVDRPSIGASTLTVALDGDHKEPYLVRLESPGARRTIWFAKKYAYSTYAPQAGPAASQAVLNCWSFMSRNKSLPTTVRQSFEPPAGLMEFVKDSPRENWGAAIDERGWPCRAFQSEFLGTLNKSEPEVIVSHNGVRIADAPDPSMAGLSGAMRGGAVTTLGFGSGPATASSSGLMNVRALPLRPVWWALGVNTLFYGAVWFGVIALVAAAKERWFTNRGGCPKCGYDLRGQLQPGCPECGWEREAGVGA